MQLQKHGGNQYRYPALSQQRALCEILHFATQPVMCAQKRMCKLSKRYEVPTYSLTLYVFD